METIPASTTLATTDNADSRLPLTANFHFIKGCNYRCRYCYATFCDSTGAGARNILPDDELFTLTRLLARRFAKITFVGGEPTLYRRLPELLAAAKSEGAKTNLVTNGSRITSAWLASNASNLDFLTLSIDSDNPATLSALGRAVPHKDPLAPDHHLALSETAKDNAIVVKVNTVVTRLNQTENLAPFICRLAPARWKLLQAAPVVGQNDASIADLTPDRVDFDRYVDRAAAVLVAPGAPTIRLVPEPIETIRGSYVMVDPQGRFFDSTSGTHHYSQPILTAGIETAFGEVSFDAVKFLARGGAADFAPPAYVV